MSERCQDLSCPDYLDEQAPEFSQTKSSIIVKEQSNPQQKTLQIKLELIFRFSQKFHVSNIDCIASS